jgi:hypothetical protein
LREWFDDLRYGTRMVAKRPGTSAIAVIALALGIGLTTTMFSIVEGVLLRGLPFDRAERLLALDRGSVQEPERRRPVPLHDLADWRHEQRSFEALAGYDTLSVRAAGDGGFAHRFEVLEDLGVIERGLAVGEEEQRSAESDEREQRLNCSSHGCSRMAAVT